MGDDDAVVFWTIYLGVGAGALPTLAQQTVIYTVRRSRVMAGHPDPVNDAVGIYATSLEEARSVLPPGCWPFDRDPSDDPSIVESWME